MCSPCSSLLCVSRFYATPLYSSLPFLGPYLCMDSLMPYLGITMCPMSYSSPLVSVISSKLFFILVFHTLYQMRNTHGTKRPIFPCPLSWKSSCLQTSLEASHHLGLPLLHSTLALLTPSLGLLLLLTLHCSTVVNGHSNGYTHGLSPLTPTPSSVALQPLSDYSPSLCALSSHFQQQQHDAHSPTCCSDGNGRSPSVECHPTLWYILTCMATTMITESLTAGKLSTNLPA